MMTYPIFSKSNKIFSSVGLHPLVNNRVRRLYAYSVSGIMIVMTILYVVESCRGGWKSVKHEISSLVFTIFLSSEFFTSMMRFTRREKINRIIEQKFCSTFRTSLRKIDFQENCLIWFWLVLMCLVHIFWLLLPIIGMQNKDTEETKRVLPEILWWPFFDLSKHPHYEIAYVVEIYITVYYVIVSFDVATTVPIISLHIYGQMKVMAFYLKKVGKTDFKDNQEIIYTNVQHGSYVVVNRKLKTPRLHEGQLEIPYTLIETYMEMFVKDIIRYHNMILSVTREFTDLKHVNMIQRFTVVTVLLITVTTQINKTYSPPLALMFIIGIVSWEFNLCLSSELIDSGNERIFAAAYDNAWWICTNRVRRMLSFMMCRTRAANHIKLFGFLIVSYALIPETLRFSYSVYILLESSN
ncbi:hypothetical protein M8J76_015864 [Diaphorina citri]|nr:hypothetical protein M8J76_015864 [Diaphorina citri]KAI5754362.1 hypothetical protein M8J77_008000 [Diaphorina citri]